MRSRCDGTKDEYIVFSVNDISTLFNFIIPLFTVHLERCKDWPGSPKAWNHVSWFILIVDETKSIWHFSNRVALLWHDASSCTVLLLRISPTLHEQKHHFPMLILQLSAANCPRFSEIPNICGQICIWNEHLGENNLSKEKVSRAASCKGYVEKKPQQDVFGAFTSLPNFFSLDWSRSRHWNMLLKKSDWLVWNLSWKATCQCSKHDEALESAHHKNHKYPLPWVEGPLLMCPFWRQVTKMGMIPFCVGMVCNFECTISLSHAEPILRLHFKQQKDFDGKTSF